MLFRSGEELELPHELGVMGAERDAAFAAAGGLGEEEGEAEPARVDLRARTEGDRGGLVVRALDEPDRGPAGEEPGDVRGGPAQVGLEADARLRLLGVEALVERDRPLGVRGPFHVHPEEGADARGVAGEVEAVPVALALCKPGDLLLVFCDKVSRTWKQIIYHHQQIAGAGAVTAAPEAASWQPSGELTPEPEIDDSVSLQVGLVRDERGVRLPKTSEEAD